MDERDEEECLSTLSILMPTPSRSALAYMCAAMSGAQHLLGLRFFKIGMLRPGLHDLGCRNDCLSRVSPQASGRLPSKAMQS